MKAIVLCAGEGTRLRPLSFTGPKHLIPIANKPIVIHIIEAIVEVGIHDIGIVINRGWKDAFREALANARERWNAHVEFIYQDQPLGLAHAAGVARDFVAGEPFLMYLGDNLLEKGLHGIVEQYHQGDVNAVVSLHQVPNPAAFGVAELEGARIVRVVEKPKDPKSNWAIIGVYVFDPRVFDVIDTLKPSWRGEYEVTDAIQGLIDGGLAVVPQFVKGWWIDAGTPGDMVQANRRKLLQLTGNAQTSVGAVIVDDWHDQDLPEGTTIQESEVRGPVIIGKGSRIEDSFIGPFTSIGDEVAVVGSEVENSILLNGCQILDFGPRLDKSIIGRRARLTARAMPFGSASTFVLADQSVVNLRWPGP
jgi:glucose-1-phosphate thymidylyltransferase